MTKYIENSLLLFLTLLFLSISSVGFLQLRLPTLVMDAFRTYGYEVAQFKKALAKRKSGEINFDASKRGSGETYIVIIGESLNRKHMGVYGYARETTPRLSKMHLNGKLLLFDNAYSNHTHTVFVLDHALTEANQYNGKKFHESLSIIDVLKKAGFETYWLTNQPIYSIYDNMVSIIGTSADHLVALNTAIGGRVTATPKYDGALVEKVEKILHEKTDKNRVIFVHLGGSHSTYSARYPNDTYTYFSSKVNKGLLGDKACRVPTLNDYDNSVYYNDYVVSTILELAEKMTDPSFLLYMSDHADDVINQRGHNSSLFTYTMTQIPLLMWFNEEYKEKYSQRYLALVLHKNRLFSNDLLYDTMIGIFGIKTKRYQPQFDLSTMRYKLDPAAALALHGKKRYIDKENYAYWQKENSRYLMEHNLSTRLFPAHINSIGKFKEVWHHGFRSFSLDLLAKEENGRLSLRVGRDEEHLGLLLDRYLQDINMSKAKRIILDFKKINNVASEDILQELTSLDNKYNLKEKVLLVFPSIQSNLGLYINLGWKTAYKIDNKQIIDLINENNDKKSYQMAKSISKQIQNYTNKNLLFMQSVYPWIKRYLMPLLDEDIGYHCYSLLSLHDTNFANNLTKIPIYNDDRIKTILIRYKSQFEL